MISDVLLALGGIVFGSVGAVLLQHRLSQTSLALQQRRVLVEGYLFQLQDAAEALSFRLQNLLKYGGRSVMTESYFAASTLYAVGRVLAIERLFVIKGVYAQLEEAYPQLGHYLRAHRLDASLRNLAFHQYDRLALAESIIQWDNSEPRLRGLLEFRSQFDEARKNQAEWVDVAVRTITNLAEADLTRIRDTVVSLANKLAAITRLPAASPS
jgi:hypothetical protein